LEGLDWRSKCDSSRSTRGGLVVLDAAALADLPADVIGEQLRQSRAGGFAESFASTITEQIPQNASR
jgi:hypothetical protein